MGLHSQNKFKSDLKKNGLIQHKVGDKIVTKVIFKRVYEGKTT